ncbi:MAG: 16S rRNA (guanine(966)-N(2))-methyltransferase RsmD [Lachnospiraceae bacterium]|nr:16S rRNA (guanine(966)-N(2))-methyltransferase RsmD [Lachnospiraceae bacterium]
MRVIAGSKRSIPLVAPEGLVARPTSDRIKETLFNILNPIIPGALFLDLFSGSGQIGIEALSRGAKRAVFVDSDRRSISAIKENIKKTDFPECSEIQNRSVSSFIATYSFKEPFDIIFMDPPYDMREENIILEDILKHDLLSKDGLIVSECASDNRFYEKLPKGLCLKRVKDYGKSNNCHIFMERDQNEK